MLPLEQIIRAEIYGLMGLCVIAALLSVLFRNLFHAALALTGTLFGIAGIYLALHADFLAMIQILIYVGAIMTLVVFAIMLTDRFTDQKIRSHNPQKGLTLCGGFLLIGLLTRVILTTPWPNLNQTALLPAARIVSVMDLGKALLGNYVFPFEMISIILIAALIGAIVVARKDIDS